MHSLASGPLTTADILLWTAVSIPVAAAAGALSGMLLAGKDLGNALAASMGAMFGPVAAVPGILITLIILAFL
jgi:hypothetical protein